jgi:thiosulfate dehydrogenase (quinone) large subunit
MADTKDGRSEAEREAVEVYSRDIHSERTDRDTLGLSMLRIGVAALFLIFGEYKVFGTQFTLGGGFQGWIERFLSGGAAYPFMVPVLRSFVLPHKTAIAFLVAYGELAIGLALVLGVLVRIASIAGLVYMLALLFSSNYPGAHAPPWQYFGAALDHLVLAMCFAAFAISEPSAYSLGRVIGLRRARGPV